MYCAQGQHARVEQCMLGECPTMIRGAANSSRRSSTSEIRRRMNSGRRSRDGTPYPGLLFCDARHTCVRQPPSRPHYRCCRRRQAAQDMHCGSGIFRIATGNKPCRGCAGTRAHIHSSWGISMDMSAILAQSCAFEVQTLCFARARRHRQGSGPKHFIACMAPTAPHSAACA